MKTLIRFLFVLSFVVFVGGAKAQFTNNLPASGVLGQTSFNGYGGAASESKLNGPNGVTIDQATGKLFVADRSNHRILRWSSTDAYTNGSAAEAVFGQTNFTDKTSGAAANKFNNPIGVVVDKNGRLWVGDFSNNRILRFDDASTKATGANADAVLGQSTFTGSAAGTSAAALSGPVGVCVDDNGGLWVSDYNNSRVLRYDNAAAKPNGGNADLVLGQADFASKVSALSATALSYPNAVYVDVYGNLYVSDFGNKRVLRYDKAVSKANGAAADGVLGQANFTSNVSATTRNGSGTTRYVWGDKSGRLYVIQEDNQRILVFDNAAAKPNGADADGVLGQADFVSKTLVNPPTASSLNVPRAMVINNANGHVWVADYSNNRVLRFEIPPVTPVKSLKLTSPDGGEEWGVGTSQRISWTSAEISKVKLEYSTNNGTNWKFIDSVSASAGYYAWTVPGAGSATALVKISDNSDNSLSDVSNNTFIISDKVIVVIGSSTAAGNGASTLDSAWVWRYRRYVKSIDPKAMVVNLAVGGYTTYDVMASDYVPPQGRPTPKTGNNITYALTFKPNAIIVNLPSNDAANGYPLNEQMANYASIYSLAGKAAAKMWITTSQPKYLTNLTQRALLVGAKDSILAVYKTQAINVWDGLAASDATILSQYNSGDGTHLNDLGHKFIFDRVVAAKIMESLEIPVELTSFSVNRNASSALLVWATATETNNKGFEIQRRTDKTDFTTIAFIGGSGTSSEKHYYSFKDDLSKLNGADIAYRLKQVDFDGSFSYSQVVETSNIMPAKFDLAQNFPNPFNPSTVIRYSVPSASKVELKVFDMMGREVKTLVSDAREAGTYNVSFDASSLASGVYTYRINASGASGEVFSQSKKMMLIK
jgi:sugar lactone lactonase YvrE/lysophospholipase L1-like esterase